MAQGPKDAARPREDELSIQMMGAVISGGPQDRTQFCVLLALANYADDFGFAFPQISTIAANSRCDEKTARRQIAELEAGGWIYVARKVLNGKCNVYILNISKIGVTPPSDGKRNPVFLRLLKTSPGAMTPIFAPERSAGMKPVSTDNPQGVQRASGESQRAFDGGSAGKLCPTNRYNRQSSEPSGTVKLVEPTPLPPLGGGARPPVEIPSQATADRSKWNVVKNALKLELTSMPKHPNFRRMDPEQADYDACFRDWWFDRIERSPRQWDFMTSAAVPATTERGVEKYGKRLEWLLRQYFPIPKTATVRVLVCGAEVVSDAVRAGPASAELAAS